MIYLDTHVVIWLYQKVRNKFTPETLILIDREKLLISPMVEIELEYLFEIDRINIRSQIILEYLKKRIGLKVCDKSFPDISQKALSLKWTRDPFDRIITAHAGIDNSILITKDKQITKYYAGAVW